MQNVDSQNATPMWLHHPWKHHMDTLLHQLHMLLCRLDLLHRSRVTFTSPPREANNNVSVRGSSIL